MAAPSYTEDLTDLSLAESTTNWVEPTATGWGFGGAPTVDADYPFIQDNLAISQTATKAAICALMYNAGTGITLPTDGAYFVWHIFTAPTALDTYANGGMGLMVGNSQAAFYSWDVGGKDFGRNPYGGWQNQVVNPAIGSPDDTLGTPTSTQQYIGAACRNLTAIGKGNPHAVDAIRYGRGSSIFELGESATPATFNGYATENDAQANRWGLIQKTDSGYLYKGKMTFGTATNAVYFSDLNAAVIIDNTPKVTANFNTIEVNNASSTVIWDNVSVTAIGTVSKGRWLTNDNATIQLNNSQFVDMATFAFLSNTTLTSVTFRRCGLVTQGGATLTSCIFEKSTNAAVALQADNPTLVTYCTFIPTATAYRAIELSSANSGQTRYITGNIFNSYAAYIGSGTSDAIWNNSGGTVTLISVDSVFNLFTTAITLSTDLSTFTGCTFNKFTSTATITTATPSLLSNMSGCTFISDGDNHAIQITAVGSGSFNLVGHTFTGYDTTNGLTTSTNAVIYNNSGGHIDIYPSGNTGTISYRNGTGATTTIVASSIDFTFMVSPAITAYEWRMYSVTAAGSLAGAVELAGEESAGLSSQTYTYSYTSDISIAVQILAISQDYVESVTYYTLGSDNQSVTINLTKDANN
ncbi:MAG: hypothetical protein JXI43_13010 [Tissierellales bacterium]|nr:hypothetical protein [Tissierellales bacterium]